MVGAWSKSVMALLLVAGCSGSDEQNAGDDRSNCPTRNIYTDQVSGGEPWCLPRSIAVSADGAVTCELYVVRSDGHCDCDAAGRTALSAQACPPTLNDPSGEPYSCACRLQQLAGAELSACITSPADPGFDGWCYVDAAPQCGPAGASELLTDCSEQKRLRFLGGVAPGVGETLLVSCNGGLSCN